MRIIPNDHGVLTLPAYAILDNMLNVPERDYRTFEEMCSFFPKNDRAISQKYDKPLLRPMWNKLTHNPAYVPSFLCYASS